MVGASDFVPGGLRVRQLLITHLSAEPAMLREFSRWLAEDTRLVSYNGRCYDAPLLAARYRLARQGSPLAGIEHLDLLFPTRRRYRGVWENCRLATIERRALGIVREDDLPGSEAPGAWLQGVEAAARHVVELVAQHLADRAQLAPVAVAGAQQGGGGVAAAVGELGEVQSDDLQQREVVGERGDVLARGQPHPQLAAACARQQLVAARLPHGERHQHGAGGHGDVGGGLALGEAHGQAVVGDDAAVLDDLVRHGRLSFAAGGRHTRAP